MSSGLMLIESTPSDTINMPVTGERLYAMGMSAEWSGSLSQNPNRFTSTAR